MARKTKGKRDTRASCRVSDTYGAVYVSMLEHDNYKALKCGAKQFYTVCRAQAASRDGISCLMKYNKEYTREYDFKEYFTFPAEHLNRFNIDKANANMWFRQLIEAGFIEKVEDNHSCHKVNIYKFSDKWQKQKSYVSHTT